jgi:hypothetical protein
MANERITSELARTHVYALGGLGPGLTPFGDGFLIGILGVFALFHSHSKKIRNFFENCKEAITGVFK